MTSQGTALRRPYNGDVARNEGNTSANRRVVTVQEVVAHIGDMVGAVRQENGEVRARFFLTHPRDVMLTAADFQPLSLIARSDVVRTVPYLFTRCIAVRDSVLIIMFFDTDVIVSTTPYMSRGVTELHVDRYVIRYFRGRRLAYGESIY